MGRTQTTCKVCRREGEKICDSAKCAIVKRNYPPGVHGPKRRRRISGYGAQLRMKQKAKSMYGLRERQFKNLFQEAAKSTTDVGEQLLRLLESRFDNIVFRIGFASTRAQARQLVTHAHFLVNGKKVNAPSYRIKPSDEIGVKESSKSKPYFKESTGLLQKVKHPDWLVWNGKEWRAKLVAPPDIEDVKRMIDSKFIVEYYSK